MRRWGITVWIGLLIGSLSIVQVWAQTETDAAAGTSVANATIVTNEQIAAYPAPNITMLAPNDEVLTDRWYQRVLTPIEIFDTPNGNITGTLAAGFNYVTSQGTADGWTQINPDQWVRSEALSTVSPSTYSGVLIPEALPYPIGWILVNVTPSRTPGAEPLDEDINNTLLRFALVNLYNSIEVDEWNWYQVGIDQWVHQTLIAKMLPIERPVEVDTDHWISVDLYEQVVIAYEGTTPVFATLVSSGLEEWPTNEGTFNVYVRFPRTIMSGAEGQSDFYFLEEVPWTMYFDNDIGLHGTYWHSGFGYRHSHGCVNLSITDAHWLYQWAYDEVDLTVEGDLGAAVHVYSSGVYR